MSVAGDDLSISWTKHSLLSHQSPHRHRVDRWPCPWWCQVEPHEMLPCHYLFQLGCHCCAEKQIGSSDDTTTEVFIHNLQLGSADVLHLHRLVCNDLVSSVCRSLNWIFLIVGIVSQWHYHSNSSCGLLSRRVYAEAMFTRRDIVDVV